MRICVMVLLLIPAGAGAQTGQSAASAPALAAPTTSAPLTLDEISPGDRARPLAGSKNDNRILSKNETYNLGRIAEGRVGVRLGNDLSYRITGN